MYRIIFVTISHIQIQDYQDTLRREIYHSDIIWLRPLGGRDIAIFTYIVYIYYYILYNIIIKNVVIIFWVLIAQIFL